MIEIYNFQNLEEIIGEKSYNNLNTLYQTLYNKIQVYLNLEPIYKNENVIIKIKNSSNSSISKDIFSIGVKKYIQNGSFIIEIDESYVKYLDFILLREIYNQFISIKLREHEIVQIIINKIIITHLNKSPLLNQWRALIRKNLENYDILSEGVGRLFEFDRFGKYLKIKRAGAPHDPIQFFFKYLRENIQILNDKIEDICEIFFQEFANYILESETNDEVIETIRCIIEIFYNVKSYKNILRYKDYFQEFKDKGEIETELSQRKFGINMDWIKENSYIAPSYQLNWNTINISIISLFIRFNPILEKAKIYEIIHEFPFFVSPKVSYDSFALDISGYAVIPNIYLNDFYRFIEKLEDLGYIIKHQCLLCGKNSHNVNLNYLRDYSKKHRIINPDHPQYNKKNEIEFTTNLGINYSKSDLSLLDFLVLDRIRFYSVSGIGFERRNDLINAIKSDLLNELITERAQIKNLKDILKKFIGSNDIITEIIQFLEVNKKFGFFYIQKMLETSCSFLKLMERILNNNSNIKHFSQFYEFVEKHQLFQEIEDKIIFKDICAKNGDVKEFFNLFFQSKKHYKEKKDKIKLFSDLISCCFKLKIFNVNSIKKLIVDQKVVNQIYKTKEAKLKAYYEKWKLYKITFQEIENTIDKFLNNNPPIIKPLLINTLLFQEKGYLQLVLLDSEETQKILKKMKMTFPRVLFYSTKCLESNKNLIYIEISTPYMTIEEKEQFFSILYNTFRNTILYGKAYLWVGWIPAISRKNFYDFDSNQFFYTKDLYKNFFLYVQQILGDPLKQLPKAPNITQDSLWSKKKSFGRLIQTMNYYDRKENIDFSFDSLTKLIEFNNKLKDCLLQPDKFNHNKKEYFYKNYVKSIKCIPAYHHFGLEEFFLYVYPTDRESIDFKGLLSNTFQNIKYPACIDESNSFLIKYVMPYHFPNKKYINWLSKAKNNIREYIAFSVRKIHRILHFNTNLESNGWEYDPDKFKIYFQNILFNQTYKNLNTETQIYDLDEISDSRFFEPNSNEFDSLTQVYSWQSIDLKSFIGAKKYSIENHIKDLLKKDLIYPFLSLKNLGIQDKIYIILPNLKTETISILIKIFNFFNIGFIYEIEGEFFISGFNNKIKFENGLMIKLYLPKCNIGEFEKLFDLLFQYLDISHYLILNDLVDGSNLIKSLYGDLNFLKEYNPLNNLKWSKKDKIWLNHNVLSKENGFIYPDLIPKGSEKE